MLRPLKKLYTRQEYLAMEETEHHKGLDAVIRLQSANIEITARDLCEQASSYA